MATQTTYHKLRKPDLSDKLDLEQDLNQNWDKIDSALKYIDPNDSKLKGAGLKDPLVKDSQLSIGTDKGGIYIEPSGGHVSVGEYPSFDDETGTIGLRVFGREDGTGGPIVKFASMFDGQDVPSELPDGVADRVNYNQGTVRVKFTPLWDGNDGKHHTIYIALSFLLRKLSDNKLYFQAGSSTTIGGDVSSLIRAGQVHVAIGKWDLGQFQLLSLIHI